MEHQTSRLERVGGTLVLVLLGLSALYFGAGALVSGEFVAGGYRSNPSALQQYAGMSARLSGAFLVAVGCTLLSLPWLFRKRVNFFKAAIALDLCLFLAAIISYGLK